MMDMPFLYTLDWHQPETVIEPATLRTIHASLRPWTVQWHTEKSASRWFSPKTLKYNYTLFKCQVKIIIFLLLIS